MTTVPGKGAHARRLFVVPSTAKTREALHSWLKVRPGLVVVAPMWGFPMSRLLDALEANVPPSRVVVFSDQLVSALEAPLRVRHRGEVRYLSSIEMLAAIAFGYAMRAWSGGRRSTAPPDASPAGILRLLIQYRDACDDLGPYWLVRALQIPVECRVVEARRRIRLLQSALMASLDDSGSLHGPARTMLRRLERLHRALESGKWR